MVMEFQIRASPFLNAQVMNMIYFLNFQVESVFSSLQFKYDYFTSGIVREPLQKRAEKSEALIMKVGKKANPFF